jgi:hypothetical protein
MTSSRASRVGVGVVLCAQALGLHASTTAVATPATFSTYFNHRADASFVEPHRGITRAGDNFEQVVIQHINSAQSSIDVAVMGITLPHVAQALADAARRGVRVRVVMDNSYRKDWTALTPDEVASLSEEDQEVWAEVDGLVDTDGDGEASDAERAAGDVFTVLSQAGIAVIDDTDVSSTLMEVCPALQAWHYLAPKDKLTPLPNDVDEVRLEVLSPGNGARRGVAPDLILPLGFSALLLTSKKLDAACWMAHTGSDGSGLGSRVAINCPRRGELADAMTEPAMMESLFRAMIEVWQPDWATVSHTDMSDPEPVAPVHWMLYGRKPLPEGLVLPEQVVLHDMVGPAGEALAPGQYFVTTPGERFVYGNLTHRAVCEQLKLALRQSGWLPPYPDLTQT